LPAVREGGVIAAQLRRVASREELDADVREARDPITELVARKRRKHMLVRDLDAARAWAELGFVR
jgi:hypothetical protein